MVDPKNTFNYEFIFEDTNKNEAWEEAKLEFNKLDQDYWVKVNNSYLRKMREYDNYDK